MTYRVRLMIAILLAATIPVVVFTILVRNELSDRLSADYVDAAELAISQTEAVLQREHEHLRTILATLSNALPDDNRFRRAAADGVPEERPYLLDYAQRAMNLSGLSMLQVQDVDGRIISSGHFRNEYDRIDLAIPGKLPRTGMALARVRSAEGPFVVVAAADTFSMGTRRFFVSGGKRLDAFAWYGQQSENRVSLLLRTDQGHGTMLVGSAAGALVTSPTGDAIVRELEVPLVDGQRDSLTTAVFRITYELSSLAALRAGIDRLFVVVVIGTGFIAVLLALWLAGRMSRPITELAEKAAKVDLDRLHVPFKTDRNDEVGELSRVLRSMMDRLRTSATTIREAERRATLGEMARQVNHDIKNGLAPIRNVFRHLSEVSTNDPNQLPGVFRDREPTVASGMTYLENLASSYARLSPAVERERTDVNSIIRQTVGDFVAGAESVVADAAGTAYVYADPLSLRRILENLIRNAVDAVDAVEAADAGKRSVVVRSEHADTEDRGPVIRITVADDGPGLSAEEKSKIFQDFYTTKSRGTGLGLSIVRRLVMDMEGSVRVESDPGHGAKFIVDLPQMKGA